MERGTVKWFNDADAGCSAAVSVEVKASKPAVVFGATEDENTSEDRLAGVQSITTGAAADSCACTLEKHLKDFLVSNWEKTVFAKTLALHVEDEKGATQQYTTGLGPIGILARDKTNHDWVVIELKMDKSSDAVVGRLLRYMGRVKKHKANSEEAVRGIIITSVPDDRMKYELLTSHGVSFYTYRVSFDLVEETPG